MKETIKPIIDLDEIDSDVIVGRYDFTIDNEGRIEASLPILDKLPNIVICKAIGNTRYSVFGEYTGKHHPEDKISQLLKRETEVK